MIRVKSYGGNVFIKILSKQILRAGITNVEFYQGGAWREAANYPIPVWGSRSVAITGKTSDFYLDPKE
jgi:hypothetical protein